MRVGKVVSELGTLSIKRCWFSVGNVHSELILDFFIITFAHCNHFIQLILTHLTSRS